jgi:hypothetical protein
MRDPLTTATIDAICARWDEGNPIIATETIYEDLEQDGHIARPQSLTPILDRLDDDGLITLSRGGPLNAEGNDLHGGRFIKDVSPYLLDKD